MEFDITSYVGAGPIRFGMTREEVASLSIGRMESFTRNQFSRMPTDHFVDSGVLVEYRAPGLVEAIEFSSDADPVFNGVHLFQQTAEQLEELLLKHDPSTKKEDDGLTAYVIGIGAYIVGKEDDDEPPEIVSIIAFERGYYD